MQLQALFQLQALNRAVALLPLLTFKPGEEEDPVHHTHLPHCLVRVKENMLAISVLVHTRQQRLELVSFVCLASKQRKTLWILCSS